MAARLAYLAGIVDCDGWVAFREGKNMSPVLGVGNVSGRLMDWLHEVAGGSIAVTKKACAANCAEDHVHYRLAIWRWQLTGMRAVIVLEAIEPYMIIKRERALDAIARFYGHLEIMECPARREHHMAKERLAMATLGWD